MYLNGNVRSRKQYWFQHFAENSTRKACSLSYQEPQTQTEWQTLTKHLLCLRSSSSDFACSEFIPSSYTFMRKVSLLYHIKEKNESKENMKEFPQVCSTSKWWQRELQPSCIALESTSLTTAQLWKFRPLWPMFADSYNVDIHSCHLLFDHFQFALIHLTVFKC